MIRFASFLFVAALLLDLAGAQVLAQPQVQLPGEAPADSTASPPPAQPPADAPPPPALPPPPVEIIPTIQAPPIAPSMAPSPAPAPQTPLPSALSGASVASAPAGAGTTTIGGYGQMDLKFTRVGFGNDFDGRANIRRVVLLVGHDWTDAIRSYVELEWENGVACSSCQGVAEVEQAYVDANLLGPNLKLRAGLILVPMGIINRWHEPPVFFSVDRPSFDQSIIPSTWRELGIGLVGRFKEIWHGELYFMTGLDPTHLGPDGIVGGRTSGVLTPVRDGALVGRVEVEPWLGLVAGLSGYASDMAPNGAFYDANKARISPHFPLYGWALDARARRAGFELRLVAAQFFMPRSGALMETYSATGAHYYNPLSSDANGGPVPNRTQGGYVELGYDVLRLAFPTTSAQLLAFGRAEYYNTQAAVPFPYQPNGKFDVNELTLGLSFLPIRQVVFKSDFQLRDRKFGLDEMQINFGMGWLF